MLPCKQTTGFWHLVYIIWPQTRRDAASFEKGTQMSKTASLSLSPSASLFSRFMSGLDRILMVSARAAIRNGELPYFGL